MQLLRSAIFLAIVPFTLASDCTASDSTPWPPPSSNDPSFGDGGDTPADGGGSGDDCSQYASDSAAYQSCIELVQQGECASVGGSACPDGSDDGSGDLISGPGDDLISSGDSDNGGLIRKLRARDTLTCTSSETCYQYTDDSLLCYDPTTGDYHDDIGGTGNYLDGTYTSPDGATTSFAPGETPSATAGSAASTAGSAASTAGGAASTATQTSDSESAASSSAASATGTATGASATPTSGGEAVRAGAMVGALGLVVGLVL